MELTARTKNMKLMMDKKWKYKQYWRGNGPNKDCIHELLETLAYDDDDMMRGKNDKECVF